MKNQLITRLSLQDKMNTKVNNDWRAQNFQWYRAIWTECAELMDHYGWKWWKNQPVDIDQSKLELVDINKDKIDRLITQFRFRLFEGSGLAWYYIGFSDYGIPIGLNKYKYTKT